MELKPVKSSNIAKVGYDPESQELQIEFKGGALYAYDAVPQEIATALENAESIGKHFHANVRDKFKTRKVK